MKNEVRVLRIQAGGPEVAANNGEAEERGGGERIDVTQVALVKLIDSRWINDIDNDRQNDKIDLRNKRINKS